MSDIDPVIFEFKARVDGYLSTLRSTTTRVDQLVGQQEARVRQLEAEMKRSSGAISGHLRGLAATLGAAFGAREVLSMVDGFTRLQNALRVAGLEGESLAQVQSKLVDIGGRYGVSVNALAGLYGNSAQTAKELGASQAQLLQITQATAQALKITGTSTEQAQGAILGLTQALASGTVRAEEFNQVNEGGLRPLLQAAAAGERFGGSIAKLRTEVLAGKVSSQEFFQLMLAGSDQLSGTAAKSALTLAGAFQSLHDRLTIYVGSAASGSGATAALAEGMQSLADNLDTVIPLLASIAVGLGARYVAGAVAASAATGALGTATFALQARMAGAATSTEALSFALNGLRFNPVMLAATALAAGIAYVSFESMKASQASADLAASIDQQAQALGGIKAKQSQAAAETNNLSSAQRKAITDTAGLTGEANLLATAWGRVAAQAKNAALEQARATRQKAEQNYRSADQTYQDKASYAKMVRSGYSPIGRNPDGTPIYSKGAQDAINRGEQIAARSAAPERQLRDRAAENLRLARAEEARIASQPLADFKQAPAATSPAAGGTKKGRGAGASGPSPEEIAARFQEEMGQISLRMLSAEESMAKTAEARASLAIQAIDQEEASQKRAVMADKNYDEAQKEALTAQIGRAAAIERSRVNFAKQAQLEQEAADKAQAEFDVKRDALQAQYDLAESQSARRRIALQMVEAEAQHLKAVQEAIIASTAASEAEKTRARIILASIESATAARKDQTIRSTEGPLDAWARRNGTFDPKTGAGYDTQAKAEEAVVAELERVREGIHGALSNAIGVKDPMISYLLDILLQEILFKPIANALSQSRGGGGGGGFLGSLVSAGLSFFGRASGGRVDAGQVYRVNEAASPGNVELFRPDVGGQIIPLGRTNALAAGPQSSGTVRIVVEEAPGFATRVQAEAVGVALEVYRAGAPGMIDAAAKETMRRTNRPRI